MARYRTPPTCTHCGETIAEAVYNEIPQGVFGDFFSHWEFVEHECEEKKAFYRRVQEQSENNQNKEG